LILSAIAAMSQNRVIGKNNQLPWHIPEDLKYFKEKTKNKILIMGRKTFESLGKPLPNRFHIVITRNESYDFHDPMVEVVSSLQHALELAHMLSSKYKQKFGDEVFIVGGAEIYKQSMDLIQRLYLTVIEKDYEGDAFFPEFSQSNFQLIQNDKHEGPVPFSFRTYEQKSHL
jgi:dihydrofolate reductase